METKMPLEEKIELYQSLYKQYSKKAHTLRKRAETMLNSAKIYLDDADKNRRRVEGYKSIKFKPDDPVIVAGTITGEGDLHGSVIEFTELYNNEMPYYLVQCTTGKKYFVGQSHLKAI